MTNAYAGFSPDTPLSPHVIERRAPGPTDVAIEILFCGVCHSDLHTVRGEWRGTRYPCVPGHEIVGRVTAVGADVAAFKVGDLAGVGCMVDSCRTCHPCEDGDEQYCENGLVGTYNGTDRHLGGHTFGGYSTAIVVDEAFTLRMPANLDLAASAPLLCAGITTWSPLRHWNVGTGSRVGVVGLGGLGHMAVKLAHALGAEVTLYTRTPGKDVDASALGADHVVVTTSSNPVKVPPQDLILNTVSAAHDLDAYVNRLAHDGVMVMLGVPPTPHPSPNVGKLISKRRAIAGSTIGGIAETQEMLDFCGKHGIVSDIEMIPMQGINDAYERMLKSDVKYRFVIDLASLKR